MCANLHFPTKICFPMINDVISGGQLPVTPSWLLLDTMGFGKQCDSVRNRMYLKKGFKAEMLIINNFYKTPVGFICFHLLQTD